MNKILLISLLSLILVSTTFVSAINPFIKQKEYVCYPIIEKQTSDLIISLYQNNNIVGVVDYTTCEIRSASFVDKAFGYGIAKGKVRGNC